MPTTRLRRGAARALRAIGCAAMGAHSFYATDLGGRGPQTMLRRVLPTSVW